MRRLIALDLVAATAGAALAFLIRFGVTVDRYTVPYVALSAGLPVVWLGVLALSRAYETRLVLVGADDYYQRVVRAGVLFAAGVAVTAYSLRVELARGYLLTIVTLATVFNLLARYVLHRYLNRARSNGAYMRRVLLLGHRSAVRDLTRQLHRQPYHGLQVVGACLPARELGAGPDEVGPPVFGALDDAPAAVGTSGADTVLALSCQELDGVALRRLAWSLERHEIDLIVASALLDVGGNRITMRPVDGLPMMHVEHPNLTGVRRVFKAAFDATLAVLGLLLAAPAMLVIAGLIRRESPGPVLFRQERVGREGRPFTIIKFRTMHIDAEARLADLAGRNQHDGVLFKVQDDPRVTRVGRILRQLSLDELPQFVNVLRGEMSLVGPRPPLPSEVARYPVDMRRRLAVKPGLTGLWQVSGRSNLSWDESMRLDLRYVENWSLSLDLVIMLRTVSAVLRRSGAY